MGQYHYQVSKDIDDNRTYTKIKLLKKEERLFEIASMLGGEKPGRAAIDNAAELLN
jgi:DNA repair protein RecN (Recombination protein N)